MRFFRTIGACSLIAVASLAYTSSAASTVLTSPAITPYTGLVKATSEASHALVHTSSETFTCKKSGLEFKSSLHGPAIPVSGSVGSFTFQECGSTTITVTKPGSFEIHTHPSGPAGTGLITWHGAELTTVRHTFFGPIDCTYVLPPTGLELGTLTSSKNTLATATIDISSPLIPAKSQTQQCSFAIQLTGAYTITSPDYLDLD